MTVKHTRELDELRRSRVPRGALPRGASFRFEAVRATRIVSQECPSVKAHTVCSGSRRAVVIVPGGAGAELKSPPLSFCSAIRPATRCPMSSCDRRRGGPIRVTKMPTSLAVSIIVWQPAQQPRQAMHESTSPTLALRLTSQSLGTWTPSRLRQTLASGSNASASIEALRTAITRKQVSWARTSAPCISPQARTLRVADGSVRSLLGALAECREAASTKAVALASKPGLLLQAEAVAQTIACLDFCTSATR
jgi:hypothetical protein